VSNRLLVLRDLVEIVERQSGRPGAGALRRIIADDPAPTRSLLEDLVLDIIRDAGLETPDVNVPLVVKGRRVIPDFRWPDRHLIVEADGHRWHDDRLAREDDAERQAVLEAHGERIVRITWEQAVRRRSQTVARLRAAAAVR